MHIKMLGSFIIEYNGKEHLKQVTRLNKTMELFAMLAIKKTPILSNNQIIHNLYPDEVLENPPGALKNTAYLLRKALKDIDPVHQYIATINNTYYLDLNAPLTVDVWEFEALATLAKNTNYSPQEQHAFSLQALSLYSGDLLPGIAHVPWVIQANHELKTTYLETVYHVCDLLLVKGTKDAHKEVLDICNRAILIDPLNKNLYIQIFKSMKHLEMKQAIISYYSLVSNLFFDKTTSRLPCEIHNIFIWAAEVDNELKANLNRIQQDLVEMTREQRPIRGSYYCEYEMFKQIYPMISRNASREGTKLSLLLINISIKSTKNETKSTLSEAMSELKDCIKSTLRKGDIFSRYSSDQFVVMLSMANSNDYRIVQRRIFSEFIQRKIEKKVTISFTFQPLDKIM